MLRKLYEKHFGEKFFNRILLIYLAIIVLVLTGLAFTILYYVTDSAKREAEDYNSQVVQRVSQYISQKNAIAKQVLQQLYINKQLYSGIFDLLTTDLDYLSDDYYLKYQQMDNYLKYGAIIDNDITSIMVYGKSNKALFYYTKNAVDSNIFKLNLSYVSKLANDSTYGTVITPTYIQYYTQQFSKNVFSIVASIKSENISQGIGKLAVSFDTDSIRNSYSDFEKQFYNNVLVLTDNGDVIFDSSDKYYGSKYPYFNALKQATNLVSLGGNEYVVNIVTDPKSGIIVAGTISKSQIVRSNSGFRKMLYFILILSLLIAISLSYASITLFSKRVSSLNLAIDKVQSGNLSARINTTKSKDEISNIAMNFNLMCDKLEEYINRVYVSELNQKDAILKQKDFALKAKTAELYALQSQINPHFLYNTLEAIRMKAITNGEDEVGQMIRILANLFRRSVKDEMVVLVKNELDYCMTYLELFNIRYGDKLNIVFDIEKEILGFGILKNLLQPLIENSIQHGINLSKPTSIIKVKGLTKDNDIYITIFDNGYGIDEGRLAYIRKELNQTIIQSKSSIGIANVHQRIRLIFGTDYGIDVSSIEGESTTVTMRIPVLTKEELQNYVQSTDS